MTYPYNPVGYDPMFQSGPVNEYGSPMNFGSYGGNPNAQGWGLNSNYMTPSFLAPYRPQYMGNPNFQMPPMGFGAAAYGSTPFGNTPYYVDHQMYQAQASRELGNKVGDSLMSGAQVLGSVAVGLATAAAFDSFRFQGFGGSQRDIRSMAYAARSGLPTWLGGASTLSQARYLANSQTFLEAGGRYAGHAAGKAVGLAVSGTLHAGSFLLRGRGISNLPNISGGMARAGAFAGAVGGSLFLPWMMAEGVSQTFDRAVFTPYISGRQTADMIMDSTRGLYTGQGSLASPLTMTNANATRLGFELSRTMSDQNSFGLRAAPDIYASAASAGLFKGTGFNTHEMKKRMKDVTESVSLIMSVFNDPSTQDAIARLGQLAHGGGLKSYTDIGQLAMKYRIASAVTGVGTRELMAGVGQQGQMMYAQNGLMPYLGQHAALNAMSGISAGYRAGLISSPSLAMMGGIEGAAQLSMQAQLGLAGSPYFSMLAFNRAKGFGRSSSVPGNIANFGQQMALNPVIGYGDYILNNGVNTSAILRDDPYSVLAPIFDRARNVPNSFNKNGKLDARAFASIMASMGRSPDETRALLSQLQGYQENMSSGVLAAAQEQSFAGLMSRNNMTYYSSKNYSPGRWAYEAMRGGKYLDRLLSQGSSEPIAGVFADISDSLTNLNYRFSQNYATSAGVDYARGLKTEDLDKATIKSYSYDTGTFNSITGRSPATTSEKLAVSAQIASGYAAMQVGGTFVAGGTGTAATGVGFVPGVATALGGTALAAYGGYQVLSGSAKAYMLGKRERDLSRGPSPYMERLVSQLDTLGEKDKSLLTNIKDPNGSQLNDIAKALNVDTKTAREAAAWYSSRTTQTKSVSVLQEFMNSASQTMGQRVEDAFSGWGNGKNEGEIRAKIDALSEPEKLTLMAFARKYRTSLSNPEDFLSQAKKFPVIQQIITKMGFGAAFTGYGAESEEAAKDAMIAVNAMVSGGGLSNMMNKSLEVAASMVADEKGFDKLITLADIKKHFVLANDAVASSNRVNRLDASSAGRLASDNPQSLISEAVSQDMAINETMSFLKNKGDKIDLGGMLQASATTQMNAANIMKEAAEMMRDKNKGYSTTWSLSTAGRLWDSFMAERGSN